MTQFQQYYYVRSHDVTMLHLMLTLTKSYGRNYRLWTNVVSGILESLYTASTKASIYFICVTCLHCVIKLSDSPQCAKSYLSAGFLSYRADMTVPGLSAWTCAGQRAPKMQAITALDCRGRACYRRVSYRLTNCIMVLAPKA